MKLFLTFVLIFSMGLVYADTTDRLSGPYRYKNLEIHLLHRSEAKPSSRRYVSLQEAMEKGMVTVYETGNVQSLSIENTAKDAYVFVQSGEIIKGGRQDRVVQSDIILPPASGKIPLAGFCVEAGRWRQRGNEEDKQFSSSNEMVSSRSLKLAAKHYKNQAEVWNNVASQQQKLSANLAKIQGKSVNVQASDSSTSLQLTLENKELEVTVARYRDAIGGSILTLEGVVGFSFSINGMLNSADVYHDSDLFQALWPKLLKSAIVEAISEYDDKKAEGKPVDVKTVKAMLVKGRTQGQEVKNIDPEGSVTTVESEDYLFSESHMPKSKQWVHRSYIKKSPKDRTTRLGQTVPLLQNNIQHNLWQK